MLKTVLKLALRPLIKPQKKLKLTMMLVLRKREGERASLGERKKKRGRKERKRNGEEEKREREIEEENKGKEIFKIAQGQRKTSPINHYLPRINGLGKVFMRSLVVAAYVREDPLRHAPVVFYVAVDGPLAACLERPAVGVEVHVAERLWMA